MLPQNQTSSLEGQTRLSCPTLTAKYTMSSLKIHTTNCVEKFVALHGPYKQVRSNAGQTKTRSETQGHTAWKPIV